jgi:hypothetical protein
MVRKEHSVRHSGDVSYKHLRFTLGLGGLAAYRWMINVLQGEAESIVDLTVVSNENCGPSKLGPSKLRPLFSD